MSLLKHLEQEAAYLLSELKKLANQHTAAYGDHDDRLKGIIAKLDEHVTANAPAPAPAEPAPVAVDPAPEAKPAPTVEATSVDNSTTATATGDAIVAAAPVTASDSK